ncbi:hypothetical protein C0J52_17390 [Blattella germanica]|nr:hypothetical protein C0J52_17390 [Blattella germanica]
MLIVTTNWYVYVLTFIMRYLKSGASFINVFNSSGENTLDFFPLYPSDLRFSRLSNFEYLDKSIWCLIFSVDFKIE